MLEVLMVDDHKVLLSGVKILLEQHNMRVTLCYSGMEALHILQERSFDILIYDLKMPDLNGLELTKKTLEIHPESTIIILTGEDVSVNFDVLLQAGVSGIVEKSCSDTQLIASIHMALEKMVILPLQLVRKLQANPLSLDLNESELVQPLTEMELTILQQAAAGRTNKEIGEELRMVTRNVEYHLTNLYRKLKVTSRAYAIKKAIMLNLITTG